jgi:hypothetical protein
MKIQKKTSEKLKVSGYQLFAKGKPDLLHDDGKLIIVQVTPAQEENTCCMT